MQPNAAQVPPLSQPPMPPSLGQSLAPLPTIVQPPMSIPPPPPPPPVGMPPDCQAPVVHPIMGQPPILGMSQPPILGMSQPAIPQPPMGLPPVPPMTPSSIPLTPSSIPLTIRGDLMPQEESVELGMEQQECSNQESECEPPAPGTEEVPMEDLAPSPSKFLIFFVLIFKYVASSMEQLY